MGVAMSLVSGSAVGSQGHRRHTAWCTLGLRCFLCRAAVPGVVGPTCSIRIFWLNVLDVLDFARIFLVSGKTKNSGQPETNESNDKNMAAQHIFTTSRLHPFCGFCQGSDFCHGSSPCFFHESQVSEIM